MLYYFPDKLFVIKEYRNMPYRKRKIMSFLLVTLFACNLVCMVEAIDDLQVTAEFCG